MWIQIYMIQNCIFNAGSSRRGNKHFIYAYPLRRKLEGEPERVKPCSEFDLTWKCIQGRSWSGDLLREVSNEFLWKLIWSNHKQGLMANILIIHKLYSGNRTSTSGNSEDTELENWVSTGQNLLWQLTQYNPTQSTLSTSTYQLGGHRQTA